MATRTEKRPARQLCPRCKVIVETAAVYTWADHYLVRDTAACPACGAVLWDWTWESTCAAAQEARAAQKAPGKSAPPKPRGQLSLW